MDPESVLQALIIVWPDLPELLGSAWEELRSKVQGLVGQLQATSDPGQRFALVADLILVFRDHPQARRRLQEVLLQVSQQRGPIFRGPTPTVPTTRSFGFTTLLAKLSQLFRRANVTRYADVTCPRRVWIREPRFTVTVRLKIQPSKFSASEAQVTAPAGKQVTVIIQAPGFRVLTTREQTTQLLDNADSPPMVFDLQPELLGETRIHLDFFLGNQPLGTTSVSVEVTEQESSPQPESSIGRTLRLSSGTAEPDFVLSIAYERWQDRPALTFALRRAGGVDRTFTPVPLDDEPMAHANRLFEQLTVLTSGLEPTAKSVLGAERYLPAEDIDRRLKQLGQNLWRDLVPPDFKRLYAEERAHWRQRSLLILSDEPFFPWELLWPYQAGLGPENTWQDDQPWCLNLQLSRWLRRDAKGYGNDSPPPALNLGALVCLAPTDSGLVAAQEERRFLLELARKHGWFDLSPSVPTRAEVLNVLADGGYDWLHAAAHGNFYPAAADSDSALWLQEDQTLSPEAIVGPEMEGYIMQHRPAFVFNACHSARQAWTLTRLAGWANRLISCGAGLFLAPLWTVNDARALDFARTFYQELLQGKTVGEAVQQGRLAARREGDPTWLAYSVYAHPNARVMMDSALSALQTGTGEDILPSGKVT